MQILAEDITPTLEKLRDERQHYLQWAANNTEMERLARFVTAYDYTKAKSVIDRAESEKNELQQQLEALLEAVEEAKETETAKEEEVGRLSKQKEDELSEAFKALCKTEETCSKELVKVTTSWENQKSTLGDEEKLLTSLTQQRKCCATNHYLPALYIPPPATPRGCSQ